MARQLHLIKPSELRNSAKAAADALRVTRQKIVFAESCTAGMISASLGQLAGISDYLCGSLVTYRDRSKSDWLRIQASLIGRESAVSKKVALEMALGALRVTPEANLAFAITGHLGPGASARLDGVIFVAVATRNAQRLKSGVVKRFVLARGDSKSRTPRNARQLRINRQLTASHKVLQMVRSLLLSETEATTISSKGDIKCKALVRRVPIKSTARLI